MKYVLRFPPGLVVTTTLSVACPQAPDSMSGHAPHSANPILPGYYADPSLVHDGGRTCIYATLDPLGDKRLAAGATATARNRAVDFTAPAFVLDDFMRKLVAGSPFVVEKTLNARCPRLVSPEDIKGFDITLIEQTIL